MLCESSTSRNPADAAEGSSKDKLKARERSRTHAYARTHARIRTHAYARTRARMHAHTHIRDVHACILDIHACIHACIHTCIHDIHAYIHDIQKLDLLAGGARFSCPNRRCRAASRDMPAH